MAKEVLVEGTATWVKHNHKTWVRLELISGKPDCGNCIMKKLYNGCYGLEYPGSGVTIELGDSDFDNKKRRFACHPKWKVEADLREYPGVAEHPHIHGTQHTTPLFPHGISPKHPHDF